MPTTLEDLNKMMFDKLPHRKTVCQQVTEVFCPRLCQDEEILQGHWLCDFNENLEWWWRTEPDTKNCLFLFLWEFFFPNKKESYWNNLYTINILQTTNHSQLFSGELKYNEVKLSFPVASL